MRFFSTRLSFIFFIKYIPFLSGFLNLKCFISLVHFVNKNKNQYFLLKVVENTGEFLTDKIDSRFNERSHALNIGLLV